MLFALAVLVTSPQVAAETYASPKNRFTLTYAFPWAPAKMVDQEVELSLLCEKSVCGPTALLSVGAFFDSSLKAGTLSDFLKNANGEAITQRVRASPMIERVNILREGRTKLGQVDAYEVVAEMTIQGGRKRIRHTIMTFNAGFVYTFAIGAPPDSHQKALDAAKPVLAAFRLTQ